MSASLLTLHILTLSYPRQTVRRIRAVLYVLSSNTWFGSIQALVTKEESSRIISRPLSFTVFLMDRTLLATYCERVNSVAWRYPSYSIWRLGRCCTAFYCGAKRRLCAHYNVLLDRCGFVFFDREFFSENLWKIFVGQALRTPVSVTVRNRQWLSSSRFFCIQNMTVRLQRYCVLDYIKCVIVVLWFINQQNYRQIFCLHFTISIVRKRSIKY